MRGKGGVKIVDDITTGFCSLHIFDYGMVVWKKGKFTLFIYSNTFLSDGEYLLAL